MQPKQDPPQGVLLNRYQQSPAVWVPPRITITASILYAHALMMGHGAQGQDSLHRALYISPHRHHPDYSVWVPGLSKERSIEVLRQGTMFFWDPLVAPNPPLALPKEPAVNTSCRKKPCPLSLTYDEFLKQNHFTVGMNHYKGDQVYGNFGYLSTGEKWADPDSEGDLVDAYKGYSEEYRLPEVYKAKSHGPRVMSPSELNQFYDNFADDVSDNEGDPRSLRIHLATYAKWAQGAVPGERYVEEVIEVPPPLSDEVRDHKPRPKAMDVVDRHFQFDLETGSLMTGVYDADETPSLILSPLGVDFHKMPVYFAHNSPETAERMHRGLYLSECIDQELNNSNDSTVSTPETFYSHRGEKNMGVFEDSNEGKEEYNRRKNKILELQQEADEGATKMSLQIKQTNRSGNTFMNKAMEGFFLERRATEMSALAGALTNSLKTKEHPYEISQSIFLSKFTPTFNQVHAAMNISSAARLNEFELAQFPSIEKHQTRTLFPELKAPKNMSSAIRLRDFESAQEPLNSLSFEDLAIPHDDEAKAAAVPLPANPIPVQDSQTATTLHTGPLRSYIPESPTPDMEKRRVRSQYRRHLAHIGDQEKISIARSRVQCEKYLQDQLMFDKGIVEKERQNAKYLEKVGVNTIPVGLVPTRHNHRPKVDPLARDRQQYS